MLWIDINGYAILNIYRESTTPEMIDYIIHLAPPPKYLIGGDFNTKYDTFEPGVQPANQGTELARWSADSSIDFIRTPGESTHGAGYVLNLTFSNIPFAATSVRPELHTGSDYETQVTIIPGRGVVPLEQNRFRIPETEIVKFNRLIRNGVSKLQNPWSLTTTAEVDDFATAFATVFSSVIEATGRPDRGTGRSVPW
jgi:hypothetical protein